jgi:hypothetical protein
MESGNLYHIDMTGSYRAARNNSSDRRIVCERNKMSVDAIERIIVSGKAYATTDADGRGYLCLDTSACPSVLNLRPRPVRYPCLDGCTRLDSERGRRVPVQTPRPA